MLPGPASNQSNDHTQVCQLNETSQVLQDELYRFWQLEEVPSHTSFTDEEIRCENHFVKTRTRLPCGRCMVRLPVKTDPPKIIGDSLYRSKILLHKVWQHLSNNPELKKQYTDFLNEYEQLGNMRRLSDDEYESCSQDG